MIKLQTLFSFEPFHRKVKESLGRLENTSMIKVVGIPARDKVSQFVSHSGDRNVEISALEIQFTPSYPI